MVDFFKKEKPFQGFSGFGGGAVGLMVGGGAKFSASGGTKDTSSKPGYVLHVFTSPGNFIVEGTSPTKTIDILLVAGGAGASGNVGGGGGAGGLIWRPAATITDTTYAIGVGTGGNGAKSDGADGSNGSDSTAFSLTAKGGGSGDHAFNGNAGGSGGGAGYSVAGGRLAGPATQPTQPGDSGTYGFGFAGGSGGGAYAGAGGGGAGGVGQSLSPPTSTTAGGTGGSGKDMSPYVGTAYGAPSAASNNYTTGGGWFAGGGGSNSPNTGPNIAHDGGTYPGIVGGAGGGGNGSSPWDETGHPQSFVDGKDGTGSGGGACNASSPKPAGNGGDGICIVRYPDAY